MNSVDVYEILRQTIETILWGSGPILIVALAVGILIGFFQALTQIQELTLTFVPKIVAIFFALALSMPFIFERLTRLSTLIFDLIAGGTP